MFQLSSYVIADGTIPPTSDKGTPSTAHFERLPVEILEKIFLELHYFDICSVKLVSGGIDMYTHIPCSLKS